MKTIRHTTNRRAGLKSVSTSPAINDSLREALLRFMEYHPANRFSRNLRKMLLDFLMQDGAVEALYFKDLIYDIEGLFELLDEIEGNGEMS